MKKIIRLTEKDLTRIVKRIIQEEFNNGCDDLCQWMDNGECRDIEDASNTENGTQEWYRQKKEQMPYYFSPNKDSRIKERWERYPDKNNPAIFWIGIAMYDCENELDWFLNLEDPCKGKNPLCV